MTISTIARPYAAAAFLSAQSDNQLLLWSQTLKQLSSVVLDKQVISMLKNPLYSKAQLADFFIGIVKENCGNGPNQIIETISNFIRLLAEKKRLALLSSISNLFEESLAIASGYLFLVVTCGFEMNGEQQKHTKEKLEKKLKSKLNIVFAIDKNIVGGLLVRSGNWVLDDTVKGKLSRLKSALI